jgi:cupin 2 domain-containing protein
VSNIFDFSLPDRDSENFYSQLQRKNVEIKSIISNRLSTPQSFVQACDEWVVVLQGCAKIEMDGVVHKLKKGDTLFIPANVEHTLLKTRTLVVWLAVYIYDEKREE